MLELPLIFRYPQELSIKCLKRNVSIKTSFRKIIKMIKIYIRFKVDADFIENNENISGVGWVEYYKIPALVPRGMLMGSAKEKYRNWRKK